MANRIMIKSPGEMDKFAAAVAENLRGGEVLALTGELGAGKTAFVKGLSKALGIETVVQSPTFLLMKIYQAQPRATGHACPERSRRGPRVLCHVDAYRIKDERELLNIGLQEHMMEPATVTAIEWADRVKGTIPGDAIWIRFEHGKDMNERIVSLTSNPD
jgi:tRNA threonylcarbamoyladenosine biosynthesis protein TsaE